MAQKVEVGSDCLSYCTSCRMDLNHVVVAMKGDRVAKVECRTCKKIHAYRIPKGQKAPAKKSTRATKKTVSVEDEWSRLMEATKDSPTKNYSTKSSFQQGDRLNHPKFGDGVVGKVIYPNKLEVVFKQDVKVLVHAGV